MNTKKSLGHFPFGADGFEKTELSFIPDMNGGQKEEEEDEIHSSPFEAVSADTGTKEKPIETELVEREIPGTEERTEVKKKVASYYLEESLINRLKAYSDAVNNSYSAVTSNAIDIYISERGY